MVTKTIPELDDGTGLVNPNVLIPFSQDDETFQAKFSDVSVGSNVVLIYRESDLPPLVNGFRTLEIDKSYIWLEPALHVDKILIPAGWVGLITKTFFNANGITYAGTGAFFNTLNLDGTILSIADSGTEPGVKSTITLTAPHGVLDDQFVNITGTLVVPAYSQQSLQVSNVTASTFDIEVVFAGTDTGLFNTGYGSMQFLGYSVQNGATADFLDLTSAGVAGSSLLFTRFADLGFLSMGIIRNGANIVGRDSLFTFVTGGLTLEDCEDAGFGSTNFLSLSPAVTNAIGLTITGNLTKSMNIVNTSFDMTAADQRPVRIDGSVTNADKLSFLNAADNNVADDYFDTSAGGLDQTDPQVVAVGNGTRANSTTISESSINGTLEVIGNIGIEEPLVDITPVAGDWIEDSSTERFSVDTTTGLVTYNGLNPVTVMIKYSLSATQTSGGTSQDLDFDLHINGAVQLKSRISFTTAGVGNFTAIVYNGGNFTINPGDTFQLFKTSNQSTNTDVQGTTLLINLD